MVVRECVAAWHDDSALAESITLRVTGKAVPSAARLLADLPPCKSHAQRVLACALLRPASAGPSLAVSGLGGDLSTASVDIGIMNAACRALGLRIEELGRDGGSLRLVPPPLPWSGEQPVRLDAYQNGTAGRMLGALVAARAALAVLDGTPALRRRPMAALTEALRAAGATVTSASDDPDRLPLTIDARGLRDSSFDGAVIDAGVTTQVASGWMIAVASRVATDGRARRLRIRRPRARGYLEMTAAVVTAVLGVGVRGFDAEGDADLALELHPDSDPAPAFVVPQDPSGFAFPVVLAAMHGLPLPAFESSAATLRHPDLEIVGDAAAIAASPAGQCCVIEGLGARPDTFTALVALAATRPGETVLRGAPQLRVKESDRIEAMAAVLMAFGVPCEPLDDGLIVRGPKVLGEGAGASLHVPAPDDHRVVMAAAVLATALPVGTAVTLHPAAAVTKSWPGFWDWLDRAVAGVALD